MDIVSRLKKFISHLSIPVTQFADNCSIPRPSLSQLLNGRNKKVSDEFIGKIHETYPELSVLWLMFGEGSMLHTKNNEISEPKSTSIFDFSDMKQSDSEDVTPSIDFNKNFRETPSEKSTMPQKHEMNTTHEAEISQTHNKAVTDLQKSNNDSNISGTITFSADKRKKIVNIIVYYNDNSFESFVPKSDK